MDLNFKTNLTIDDERIISDASRVALREDVKNHDKYTIAHLLGLISRLDVWLVRLGIFEERNDENYIQEYDN